jgi:hypothetical protein
LAPINVSVPAPSFVSEAAPLITPFSDTALAVLNVVFELNVPLPENVSAPFFVASPSVTGPPTENAFAIVRAAVLSLETEEPANVSRPEAAPNAALLPT